MIRRVLVANRGEIALRVFRTCERLGLGTVAVHTAADAGAPHVRAADDAREVPSYLDVDAVVAAALDAGADAVHPGYGFLSERATFARAVTEAGLVFVGPTAEVIEQMGRKDAARDLAVAAGVPVVPTGEDAGFPVLVKAAAGGGGKGMRVVRSEAEMPEAVAAAKREAAGAFGDDTMLVEKYVERGRHVEVQVMGDAHGTVLHLGERDCSAQRRHQKVLEEAPAPTLDDDTRARLLAAAVDLAAHVGYTGAGTVEFLLDPVELGGTGEFYFLEMNTRLQVEHPVTELVWGVDLVELQLRVADGEPVGLAQADLAPRGHAVEARVYAEDAFDGFLPQAGTADLVRWPDGVRVDHALVDGQVVGTSFDPMLGKVVAHGPDRPTALARLVEALDRTAILGLTTNTGFLRALAASETFADGLVDTAWLDRHHLDPPADDVPRALVASVAAMLATSGPAGPFQPDGFRLGADPAPVRVDLDRPVVVDEVNGTVDGRPFRRLSAADHVVVADVDGARVRAVVNVQPRGVLEVAWRGQRFAFAPPDPAAAAVDVGDGALTAPMPGTVLDVRVAEGDEVAEGQVLAVLEAMKMELSLSAPFDGVVTSVGAATGDQVALGQPVVVVTPAD